MSDYRRNFCPGGTFFLTVVSYARRPILTTDCGRQCLRKAIQTVHSRHPFTLFATVLLADHWHLIMQLPERETNFSIRVKQIKSEFTNEWLAQGLSEAKVTASQQRGGERGIWQPRFWEHTIRDEADFERCVDYIHWNPRKHGCIRRIADYPWSSFHRFVQLQQYDLEWGGTLPNLLRDIGEDWGEPTI